MRKRKLFANIPLPHPWLKHGRKISQRPAVVVVVELIARGAEGSGVRFPRWSNRTLRRHRCDVSSELYCPGATVLRGDGPRQSLHAST